VIAPFEASKLKIERATKHLQELDDAISAYFAQKPCIIVVERFPGMELSYGTHAWIARIRHPVPPSLSPIIGDVVHNLRAALDLLACDLVRVNRRNPKSVYFPFCTTAADLPKTIKERNLHYAGEDVVRVIQSLKPYPSGNAGLRAIHDMDVADKHRALLPVLGAVSLPVASILSAGKEFPIPQFSTLVAFDGQIIVGLPATQIPLGTELPARWLLAFGDGPGFKGRQVIEFLHQLAEIAKGVVNTLAALRPGATFPEASAP
jgi:hypothetical protein